ncbi:glycosyltransferase [Epidermidibacterium keratini]|uniref:Glycosyltransferase n=1 Tax=Epidermidibacterium keratini TaxID=1891644 RepID=A0A7L4YME8_9ACTN|nr:glycosyltransferase [Epidermidibacterium keratini]QHC00053.1 glycosyltransferase [Epidermidibacterium keratini]
MTDVIVSVPARNERDNLPKCLSAIATAAGVARQQRGIGVALAVADHCSSDDTYAAAKIELSQYPELDWLVVRDDTSSTVGQVRARLVEAALEQWPATDGADRWLLTTDADSIVPPDWITGLLAHAQRTHADAVTGMAHLDAPPPAGVAEEYRRIIESGVRGDEHDHVYGANLAVSLRAYREVGGFADVSSGEDRDLIRRLRIAGWAVSSTLNPAVVTSARHPGRATVGLGALLERIYDRHAAPHQSSARARSSPLSGGHAGMSPARGGRAGTSPQGRGPSVETTSQL